MSLPRGVSPGQPFRRTEKGVMLAARLTPKASRDEIAGLERFDGAVVLKVRVRALPEAGRANDALTKLVARWLEVPPSCVTVAHGTKSRLKQVLIEGDPASLVAIVLERLAVLKSGQRGG